MKGFMLFVGLFGMVAVVLGMPKMSPSTALINGLDETVQCTKSGQGMSGGWHVDPGLSASDKQAILDELRPVLGKIAEATGAGNSLGSIKVVSKHLQVVAGINVSLVLAIGEDKLVRCEYFKPLCADHDCEIPSVTLKTCASGSELSQTGESIKLNALVEEILQRSD